MNGITSHSNYNLARLSKLTGLLLGLLIPLNAAEAQQPTLGLGYPTLELGRAEKAIPKAGFSFNRGSDRPNFATITHVEYFGECPGFVKGSLGGRFFSSSMPTSPGLRVVIRNVTPGLSGDVKPYTDREYDKGNASEDFDIRLGEQHSGAHLTILPNLNRFEYEIKRKEEVLESGSFTARFKQQTKTFERQGYNETKTEENCVRWDDKGKKCLEKHITHHTERRCPV